MAQAFLDSGAKVFLGYSEYVSAAFAKTVGVDFFEKFINDPAIETAGDVFVSGQNDGGSPAAYFQMFGDSSLEPPSNELTDGGFETGSLGCLVNVWGWSCGDTVRVFPADRK